MAEYIYRKFTTVTHEWLIPNGSAIVEFSKAYASAARAYEEIHGKKPEFDDWARVDGDDENVRILIVERVTS